MQRVFRVRRKFRRGLHAILLAVQLPRAV